MTVEVTRIACTADPLDFIGGPNWYAFVGLADPGASFTWSSAFFAPTGCDVMVTGATLSLSPSGRDVVIAIFVCDDDLPVIDSDDFADIDSDPGGGVDDVGDCAPPPTGTYVGAYGGTYDVVTNTLSGDMVVSEPDGWKTSGDFDGSGGNPPDENDANLWFTVTDTYINPSCSASVSPSTGLESTTAFSFSSSPAGGHSPYSYFWDFGDGGTSTSPSPAHTYAGAGSYLAQLTVTDQAGVQATCFISVTANHAGPVALTVSPPSTTVVEGQNALFSAVVRDIQSHNVTPSSTVSWTVTPSGCGTFAGNQFSASSSAGGQTCTVTASATFSTWTDSDSASVQVLHGPPATFQVTPASATLERGQSVLLVASVSDSQGHDITGASTVSWSVSPPSLGSAAPTTGSSTTFTAGSAVGSGSVTASAGTASDSVTITVANEVPTAAFAFSPTNPTISDNITFVDTSADTDGTIASWSWDFGDGTTSTIPGPVHRFTTNGPHTVTLTVTDNDGATASVTQTVTVRNIVPAASFSFTPTAPSTGDVVQFTDGSTDEDGSIASWSWDFGDGDTSASQNPTHNFKDAGHYDVTLVVTDDDGGSSTKTMAVTVATSLFGGPGGGGFVLPLLVIVIVAAVLVTLLALMARRKKRRGATSGPGQGLGAQPPGT